MVGVVQDNSNILWVRFEDMKQDLGSVATAVANHLDLRSLSPPELSSIRDRCSFEAMRQHSQVFEMHAPHLLQSPNRFFVSGKADRYRDTPAETRQAITDWCVQEMRGSSCPLAKFYPDLFQE